MDEIGFQPVESRGTACGWRPASASASLDHRASGRPGSTATTPCTTSASSCTRAAAAGSRVPRVRGARGCAIDDRKAWRTANPAIRAGFLRESALETDLGITPEGHFRVFRLGQWVEGVDAWLGPNGRAVWEASTAPCGFVEGAPTWVGVDVGLKRDSTAVVAVQRDDGRAAPRRLRGSGSPTADEPVDVTDVMEHLRELADRYEVEAISFDPRFFDVPAKMLLGRGAADDRDPADRSSA